MPEYKPNADSVLGKARAMLIVGPDVPPGMIDGLKVHWEPATRQPGPPAHLNEREFPFMISQRELLSGFILRKGSIPINSPKPPL